MKLRISLSVTSFLMLLLFLSGFILENNSSLIKSFNGNKFDYNSQNKITKTKLLFPLSTLSESFESSTFPPSGWVKVTPTNGSGWYREIAGNYPVPGLSIGYIITPTGGGSGVAFCNYLTGSHPQGQGASNQWLISPKLVNIQPGDSLSFWLRKFGHYMDHFQIMISTTTQTVGAMTVVLDTLTFYANDSGYVFHKYEIGSLIPSGSNIYIGFHEWVENAAVQGATFSLDLVKSTAQVVEVKNNSQIPANYKLNQNFPNPFNPMTNISYSIAKKGFVSLKIFDLLGKEIATPVNEIKNAGDYSIIFNASKISSGVYYYKIVSGGFSDLKYMILIK